MTRCGRTPIGLRAFRASLLHRTVLFNCTATSRCELSPQPTGLLDATFLTCRYPPLSVSHCDTGTRPLQADIISLHPSEVGDALIATTAVLHCCTPVPPVDRTHRHTESL